MSELINGFAEVIERLTTRFNSQAALHRVRYDAYDKLIASMRRQAEPGYRVTECEIAALKDWLNKARS